MPTARSGDVENDVRSAIDASKGASEQMPNVSLASQNANAIVGFGGNVSPA